ncbi:Conserved hypothetical protein [Candidatus Phytoplasma australiense]|uniref:Sequence-variable mosaic (SVM) signal sequence domain-containing protein n=1 Tax=Phytoplasma australiense TaxID=59748 RepID=B1VAL0_PHYAS|nr:Conserved hypothetical protein [Candidatus Phytoplasma australiense]
MLVKNKLHLLPFFLISCLGILFIVDNKQVMGMNNNLSQNNSNIDNNIDEYRIFQNLLSIQEGTIQQIINALRNHNSEVEINTLLNQSQQIHQQIITHQQRQLNNQHQFMINFERNITKIQLEREHLSLIQEMNTAINNIPIYASTEQINALRNIQIRIDQNRRQINIIIQQLQNNQNPPNNNRRR